MTDVDRQRLTRAESHAAYRPAMSAEPNTWITMSAMCALLIVVLDLAMTFWYPWKQQAHMPTWFRPYQVVSFIPTILGTIGITALFIQSLGLALQPTRRVLAMIAPRPAEYGAQILRLATPDGAETDHGCRRRAASMVRVGVISPGEIGVALCKGQAILEWVPIPV